MIATLGLDGGGRLGLCSLPGLYGDFEADLKVLVDWRPTIVVSMTEASELHSASAAGLGARLSDSSIEWVHLPVRDFGGLSADNAAAWPGLAVRLHKELDAGRGVLVHCRGGQGRSGMIALRLMVDRGIVPEKALADLRRVRPGAVETAEQMAWATCPAAQSSRFDEA